MPHASIPITRVTSTVRNWLDMVLKADGPDRDYESNHPVAYRFSQGREFRDKGADSEIYNPD